MTYLLKNATVYWNGNWERRDIAIRDGIVVSALESPDAVVSLDKCYIFPGFTDVHVQFREPGFSYKETIATGSMAAARGGYTTVCTMPNLDPVPDTQAHLHQQLILDD